MDIEQIYAEIAPKLSHYLMGNGLSYATTCDIVQETFLRLWKHRAELSEDIHEISGLVFTIARNYRNDLARKARHESLQEEITDADYGESGSPAESSPADRLEQDESGAILHRRLRKTLDRMPVQLLEAFVLARLGDASLGEIAKDMRLSETNVKVRVHRAKTLFREVFEADESAETVDVPAGFGAVFLRVLMMLSAVDGQISRTEMVLFREIAEDLHRQMGADFEDTWLSALRSAAYLGFLSGTVDNSVLVREFVREAGDAFLREIAVLAPAVRQRVFGGLTALALSDGDFSSVELDCITALSAHV